MKKSPKRKRADAADAPVDMSAAVAASTQSVDAVTDVAAGVSPAQMVTLASNCTVKDAAALKQSLCAVVNVEDAVTLDVRALERIDTATMQVLYAFVRERTASKRNVVWLGAPDVLYEAARLLGVQALLELPPAAAGGAAA